MKTVVSVIFNVGGGAAQQLLRIFGEGKRSLTESSAVGATSTVVLGGDNGGEQ